MWIFRVWTYAVMLALLCAGCGGSPRSGDEWQVRSPEAMGMDSALLQEAREYAFAPDRYTQGVVIVHEGVLVAEWYAEDADATSYAASWSVAKSFTSALIGIAIDEGLIDGVDVPMTDYFPSWEGTPREPITLRHVLSMASGLEWVEDYSPSSNSNIVQMVLEHPDQLDYAAGIPLEVEPGTRWNYSSGDTMLLSKVLRDATGMSTEAYGREVLFEPTGMEPVDWWQDADGHTLTYCCLDTPSRQFAKLGQVFLDGGRWRGEQVVPERWVMESTSPTPSNDAYGYQWWLTGRSNPELPEGMFSAIGHDGQYIYVIPSKELVVVRNGDYGKYDGESVADPNLFNRYPSDGFGNGTGTRGPSSWDNADFLQPIIDSVEE